MRLVVRDRLEDVAGERCDSGVGRDVHSEGVVEENVGERQARSVEAVEGADGVDLAGKKG